MQAGPNPGNGAAIQDAMELEMSASLLQLANVAEVAALNTVAWLRSHTDQMRPPVGARLLSARSRVTVGEAGPVQAGKRRRRVTVAYREGPRTRRNISQSNLQAAHKVHQALPGKKHQAARNSASLALIGSRGAPRPAHPGGWADVTGLLANGYSYEVRLETAGGGRYVAVIIILANPVEYASTLEEREGFFVLRGVTDPGGHLETELGNAIRTFAPDMRLVRG